MSRLISFVCSFGAVRCILAAAVSVRISKNRSSKSAASAFLFLFEYLWQVQLLHAVTYIIMILYTRRCLIIILNGFIVSVQWDEVENECLTTNFVLQDKVMRMFVEEIHNKRHEHVTSEFSSLKDIIQYDVFQWWKFRSHGPSNTEYSYFLDLCDDKKLFSTPLNAICQNFAISANTSGKNITAHT